MSDFTEEMAVELGMWLKIRERTHPTEISHSTKIFFNKWFFDWLKLPDGLHAVETAMVERGYNFMLQSVNGGQWGCAFSKKSWPEIFCGDRAYQDKLEAILMAAYKAMEADNG